MKEAKKNLIAILCAGFHGGLGIAELWSPAVVNRIACASLIGLPRSCARYSEDHLS